MLRCEHCDHFNLPDTRNCERCGAPLAVTSDEQVAAAAASGISKLESEVLEIARTQGKIQAIKRYREATGVGLKQAKEAVEAMVLRHGVAIAKGGCASSALLLLTAGVAIWRLLQIS